MWRYLSYWETFWGEGLIVPILRRFGKLNYTYFGSSGTSKVAVHSPVTLSLSLLDNEPPSTAACSF